MQRLLTSPRLAVYHAEAGDFDRAIDLYHWNRNLGAALFADISLVEVAFRNAIDTALQVTFGSPHWYWDNQTRDYSRKLEKKSKEKLKKVAHYANAQPITTMSPGKVVSELMLGFWVELLEQPYERSLWLPDWTRAQGIAHSFSGLRRLQRRPVYRWASLMQQTRNRVAHHEPIFAGVRRKGSQTRVPIADVYKEIVALAEAVHPAIAQQLSKDSRFDAVLKVRP